MVHYRIPQQYPERHRQLQDELAALKQALSDANSRLASVHQERDSLHALCAELEAAHRAIRAKCDGMASAYLFVAETVRDCSVAAYLVTVFSLLLLSFAA